MTAPTPGQAAHRRWHEVRFPDSTPALIAQEWEDLSPSAVAAWEAVAIEHEAPELAAVYRERARLIAFLAACYPSAITLDADPEASGWAVIYVDTPAGQMTWHLSERDLDLFPHVEKAGAEDPALPVWDGHTTAAKYERLARLSASDPMAGGAGDSVADHPDYCRCGGCEDARRDAEAQDADDDLGTGMTDAGYYDRIAGAGGWPDRGASENAL